MPNIMSFTELYSVIDGLDLLPVNPLDIAARLRIAKSAVLADSDFLVKAIRYATDKIERATSRVIIPKKVESVHQNVTAYLPLGRVAEIVSIEKRSPGKLAAKLQLLDPSHYSCAVTFGGVDVVHIKPSALTQSERQQLGMEPGSASQKFYYKSKEFRIVHTAGDYNVEAHEVEGLPDIKVLKDLESPIYGTILREVANILNCGVFLKEDVPRVSAPFGYQLN